MGVCVGAVACPGLAYGEETGVVGGKRQMKRLMEGGWQMHDRTRDGSQHDRRRRSPRLYIRFLPLYPAEAISISPRLPRAPGNRRINPQHTASCPPGIDSATGDISFSSEYNISLQAAQLASQVLHQAVHFSHRRVSKDVKVWTDEHHMVEPHVSVEPIMVLALGVLARRDGHALASKNVTKESARHV